MIVKVYDNHIICDSSIIKIIDNTIQISQSIEEPIIIESYNQQEKQLSLFIQKGSEIAIIENNSSLLNMNIIIEANSILKYQYVNIKNNVSIKRATVLRDATLKYQYISFGQSEDNFDILLKETSANVELNSLILSSNKVNSSKVYIMHEASYTNSNVSNYGIAINGSKIKFETIGKIENKMAKSDCRQLTRGILIGENSVVETNPILLIDEYDVKAYHGASIGKMSDDDLFYLMSRGLTKSEAFKLMLHGIINPFVSTILDENIKNTVMELIDKSL